MQKVLETLSELEAEAVRFVSELSIPTDSATLITLSGELGAGKTTFVQAVAKTLGVGETVTSPTFVLQKIYVLPPFSSFSHLIHIDAYRLKSGKELEALGFDACMRDPHNLILLEWPEQVADALPTPTAHIRMTVASDGSRTITYD